MKILKRYCFLFICLLLSTSSFYAQDVYISIPLNSIFNRTEHTIVQTIMNTQGHSNWRAGGVNPYIRSNSGDHFTHTTLPNTFLPTSILQWRLANIGGELPPFRYNDVWPGYKWFNSSYQTWYQPTPLSSYNPGNIAFTFRIPTSEIQQNAFYAGSYKIQVSQDYGRSGWYVIEFSPETFNTFVTIPEGLAWISGTSSKFVDIANLNQFKSANSQFFINLESMAVGNTVDFNLFSKIDKKEIRFKALNGNDRRFDSSILKLGGNHPKIATLPLDNVYKNNSAASNFKVIAGNRTNFDLQLSMSNQDFKTHFFEAGLYTFKLKLDLRSANNSKNAEKEIDVALQVQPLSEITMGGGNTQTTFNFNTVQQYNQGQSIVIPNQIEISNNDNFELYVKSYTNYFSSNGTQSNINASILEINVEGYTPKIALSTIPQKIISSTLPVLEKKLNINYSISAESAQTLISKEKKAYTINVIYSFTTL